MTLNKPPLGRLERLDPRTYWEREDTEFTPWLAQEENMRFLGEAIGIDLEVEAQERNVGPFRADILCKDTATGDWVLIENQLERTNHGHLGQLLTYAAGLQAVTIVWIAQRFTEEHRAALDWLNAITDERFNFFGLEIELWRIGESAIAPKFNIISQPNNWSRTIAEEAGRIQSGTLTEIKQLQLEFWMGFREHLLRLASPVRPTKPQPQHWMTMALGRSGFLLQAIAAFQDQDQEELRAEIVITAPEAKNYLALLEARRETIELTLAEPLNWHNPLDARRGRLYLNKAVSLRRREDWEAYYEWLRIKLEALQRVFAPIVKSLDLTSQSAIDTTT